MLLYLTPGMAVMTPGPRAVGVRCRMLDSLPRSGDYMHMTMAAGMRIRAVLAGLLGFTSGIAAQTPPEPPAQELAPHVVLVSGVFAPGRQPDGNSVLLQGSSGWIVVDTGRHAAHGARILEVVERNGSRIEAIVNTHWHLDHVGGNARIRAAHPELHVYASMAIEHALDGWLANYRRQLEAMVADPGIGEQDKAGFRGDLALIDLGPQLHPDVEIRSTRNWQLAGRRVRIGLVADAVTAGDVWLLDRKSGVLAAGDLVTLPVPFFDTACPARWSAALAQLGDLPFEQLVPGHGPVLDRAQFVQYRKAHDGLLACAASDQTTAQCADAWLAQTAQWVPPSDHQRVRGMLDYYFEQHLRATTAQRERFCPK